MAKHTIALADKEEVDKLNNPEFELAAERANIENKESMFLILGKIKKYFTDLKAHAFKSPANNLTTTTTGYALDATQGKALQDKLGSTDISTIGDGTVTNAISTLNSNLSNTNSHLIKRVIVAKYINTASHIALTHTELGMSKDEAISVINVNIPRTSESDYHFVVGFAWDENNKLFVYFDQVIDATVYIIIDYYVI